MTQKEFLTKKNLKNTITKCLKKLSCLKVVNIVLPKKKQKMVIIISLLLVHHSVKNLYRSSQTLLVAKLHKKNFHKLNMLRLLNKTIMLFFVRSFKRLLKYVLKLAITYSNLIMCYLEKYSSVWIRWKILLSVHLFSTLMVF